MSKAISYYDWSLTFKQEDYKEEPLITKSNKKKLNSIGIAEDEFKDYIKKWKTEHLQ
jgi:hypothetical protein